MGVRKIELMHSRFGVDPEHKCSECSNLSAWRYDRVYYKCDCYGASNSEATDWKKSNVACGLFNKDYDGPKGMWFVKHSPRPVVIEQCEGQDSLW